MSFNFTNAAKTDLLFRRFNYNSIYGELNNEPKIYYTHSLKVPIGIETNKTKDIVYLDLTSQNAFTILLGKTRVGKTVVANSILSRMQMYAGYMPIYCADVKNEIYNFMTQISKNIPKRLMENENTRGEMFDYDYYSFVETEEEKMYQPNYINYTYSQPEKLETAKYRSLAELNELNFIKNLKTRIPVFCYSHLGMDRQKISSGLAWILERIYTYAKLKNEYGANVKQRICVFGDEMQLYAEAQGKDVKLSRGMLEEVAARGAASGLGGLFITQGYTGISPKIRGQARYKVVCVGFFSNSDRDEILKEMEVGSKDEKSFFSSLDFNPELGVRECLLCDTWTKEVKKFLPFSPLNVARVAV